MRSVERAENLVRLLLAPGVGCVTVNRLLRAFGTSEIILGKSERELAAVPGVNKTQVKGVLEAARIDPRPEMELAASEGVRLLAYDDPAFPVALLEADDPPFLLYVKGALAPGDGRGIGIVGTRAASRYGREQAERFGAGLARTGLTVISGLARGIDTHAHRGALAVGGRTVAVVGCGLSHVYPPENRDLLAEVAVSAAVISEFSMDTAPARDTFPRRNRIIAGMSQGVLVVEAPERSGALITARQALEMGREVFAIPGRIDEEVASGCHRLIREGAVLVRSVEDILCELRAQTPDEEPPTNQGLLFCDPAPAAGVSPARKAVISDASAGNELPRREPMDGGSDREVQVLAALGAETEHIDNLCARLNMPVGELSATLMILELKGRVRQTPGKFFQRL